MLLLSNSRTALTRRGGDIVEMRGSVLRHIALTELSFLVLKGPFVLECTKITLVIILKIDITFCI